MDNFAEKYCHDHNIDPDRFREEIFLRVLYPRARHIRTLLSLMPGYFDADREFIDGVGRLTDMRGFAGEEADFNQDSRNRGFIRQRLNLRISTRRLKALAYASLGPSQG